MNKAKTAIAATHYVAPPILLKKLLVQNDELESIQRALEIYLESKRQLFPRFYFISNDDLLEVRSGNWFCKIFRTFQGSLTSFNFLGIVVKVSREIIRRFIEI